MGVEARIRLDQSVVHGLGLFLDSQFSRSGKLLGTVRAVHLKKVPAELRDYVFENGWLPLGDLAHINHSNKPNCRVYLDRRAKLFTLHSRCFIQQGDELTINYGRAYWTSRKP